MLVTIRTLLSCYVRTLLVTIRESVKQEMLIVTCVSDLNAQVGNEQLSNNYNNLLVILQKLYTQILSTVL